jgi:glycosyltransferase involved in cell wall biosynthesis
MKIAFVFGFEVRIGGHFKSGAGMAALLTRMGHRVHVFAPGCIDEMRELFRRSGAEVTVLPGLHGRPGLPPTALAREIVEVGRGQGGFDVYHAWDEPCTAPTYQAAVLAKSAYVFTVAGGPISVMPYSRKCQTVVFSQELVDAFLARSGAYAERLHLIRARIDTDTFRAEPCDPGFAARLGMPAEGRKVVLAMRLDEAKRPWMDTLLVAADGLRESSGDVRIIVAGEGPLAEELHERAAAIVRPATGEPVLIPIGPVYATGDLVQLYNHADVMIGSGRGILEAMACGKPAIVLGERGEGEILDAASIGAAAHANFSGRHFRDREEPTKPLAELIASLLDDPEALAESGRFSYQYVMDEFDARIGAEALVAVYEKAIAEPAKLRDYLGWFARHRLGLVRRRLGWQLPAFLGMRREAGEG